MIRLLIIEDEPSIRLALTTYFESKDYDVQTAETGAEGLHLAGTFQPDIVLLDLRLPDAYGLNILPEIKSSAPYCLIYIMTAFGEINEAIEAIKKGAENYFQKPLDLDELSAILEKSAETVRLRQEVLFCRKSPYPIIGRSKHIQGLIHLVNLLAGNPSTTVLICGETGTGKELVARNIHALSPRANSPFVDINCASIPEHMIESELFGHEAGAFTDAKSAKKGLIEIADKGTLFLDECAEMPLTTQAKLLRVIETKTFRRLGGIKDIKVDVRFMAATNRDLAQAVRAGTFREDLYYRLNVMPVVIAPLRERREDIPLLSEFFLSEISIRTGKKLRGFDKKAIDELSNYSWPGNVRELRNIIERAVILSQGQFIESKDLALSATKNMSSSTESNPTSIDEVIKNHIISVLNTVSGNKTRAAKILGISRSTLIEKIKQYKIQTP